MNTSNKKIILIPGWLQTISSYKIYDGPDIWNEKTDFYENFSADIIIGHSLGAIIAILNWEKNQQGKLILVNPPFPKRNVFNWMWQWIRFHLLEEIRSDRKIVPGIKKKLEGIKLFLSLHKLDVEQILEKIPAEDIIIVRGKEDYFFCDKKACEFIQKKRIKIVEVPKVGHDWNEIIDNKLKELILTF